MKRLTLLLLFLPVFANTLSAQPLKTILDYQVFATEELRPYLETTVIVRGETPLYVKDGEMLKAEIMVHLLLERQDSHQFVDTFSYYLYNVVPDDSNSVKNDFGEIYREFVDTGDYFIHFTVEDRNHPQGKQEWTDGLSIHFPPHRISVSEISLLSSFAPAEPGAFFEKYDYDLIPKYNNFYPKELQDLNFFMEIYNSPAIFGDSGKVLVKSSIRSLDNPALNLNHLEHRFEYPARPVVVLLDRVDILNLPSGNYQLQVAVCDTSGAEKSTSVYNFQRSNPLMDKLLRQPVDTLFSIENTFAGKVRNLNTLHEYIESMYPVADLIERKYIRGEGYHVPLNELQRFFYAFWDKRSPGDPERAWQEYQAKVEYVNQEFGSPLIKGHRTDRGRVYLQYGPPNSIRAGAYSPMTYPYQIWHYYRIDNEMNLRFVFYTLDFVSNDYQLLHSNKIGETREPAWQLYLMKGHETRGDFEQTRPEDFYGNDMDFNWDNP